MQELEPTWGRVLSVWWLVAWRGVLGAALIGAAAGFVLSSVGAWLNWPEGWIEVAGTALGLVIGALWGIIVVRMALRKQFKRFRVALVPA